jgi:hypothetical protein
MQVMTCLSSGLGREPAGVSGGPSAGSVVRADLNVDDDAEVVVGPEAVSRLVEPECCGADVAVRLRVGVSGADEDVVEPAAVPGLADDLLDLAAGVGVADGPGVPGALPGDLPRVVVVDAAPGDRLVAGKVADAGRVGAALKSPAMIVGRLVRWRASRSVIAMACRSRAAASG